MSAKEELLKEVEELSLKKLDFNYFLYVLLAIVLVVMLFFPKIYLAKHIYYKSRDIAKLQVEYNTLKEENRDIEAKVEQIKYKNKIADTMF